MKELSLFLLLAIGFSSCSVAQQKYSINDKKAIRLYEEALEAPRLSIDEKTGMPNYKEGASLLEKAIQKEPNFWEAHLLASEFYEYIGEIQPAIAHLEQGIRINPNHAPSGASYFFLANLLQANGQYEESNKRIDEFLLFKNSNPDFRKQAIAMKQNSLFAIESMNNPIAFDPINIGPGINTEDDEYFPTITVDGKTILFTRQIKDNRVLGPFKEQEDFFISQLSPNRIWQTAVAMPSNVNTVNNEGAPTLAPDGRSLIFVACPDASGENYGEGRYGRGSCDLFYTKRLGRNWTNPQNLVGLVNTANWETQPSLSADGKTLYFIRGVRDRSGMMNSDIYVSHLDDDGKWGAAQRLPDIINSPQQEESVLIHPDGRTLYFASKGHQGLGGTDLFVSRMDANGNWTKPQNLGYPINTRFDENSLMVSAEGEIAFFASDRAGGFGGLDIYHFVMPENLRPTKTLYFEGLVYDAVTRKPIPGKFQLLDLEKGTEIIYSEADNMTGEFMVSLPVNRQYALNVTYPGYGFFSSYFDMKNLANDQAIHMDVPMVPLNSEIPTVLNNVFFDLAQASLRVESFIELDKLKEFLDKNPTVKMEIGGHTDTRGNQKENMILSTNRAKAVYDYLIRRGVDPNRLSYKGYGQNVNVISDEQIARLSSETVKEAAHQKNRRTEYKIVK
jgi:outer membrane protein OmpA-like peptidoglycan-associated protein/Tol biopolymer transport system component